MAQKKAKTEQKSKWISWLTFETKKLVGIKKAACLVEEG